MALPYPFVVKFRMGKDQAAVVFRRLPSGDVVGEIIDASGKIVMSKNFGDLSDEEISLVIGVFKEENPDVDILPGIEVSGN